MVPSHSLESAVDLSCFIQETVLTQIFEAVAVSQPACCADDPMPCGSGKD